MISERVAPETLTVSEVGPDQVTVEMLKAARRWLGWTQMDLAIEAGMKVTTVRDFEAGDRKSHPGSIEKMQAALRKAGVILIPNGVREARPGEAKRG